MHCKHHRICRNFTGMEGLDIIIFYLFIFYQITFRLQFSRCVLVYFFSCHFAVFVLFVLAAFLANKDIGLCIIMEVNSMHSQVACLYFI